MYTNIIRNRDLLKVSTIKRNFVNFYIFVISHSGKKVEYKIFRTLHVYYDYTAH